MGGLPPLGYDNVDKKFVLNADEAVTVRCLFELYLELGNVRPVKREADRRGFTTKHREVGGRCLGGKPFTRGHLYQLLHNLIYVGEVRHKGETYPGRHEAIVSRDTWEAAQRRPRANVNARRGPRNGTRPHLMTGLIFDAAGERLSPTHATKRGRRYDYYISRPLMHGGHRDDGDWRVPAKTLDQAVVDVVIEFLRDGPRLIDAAHRSKGSPTEAERLLGTGLELAEAMRSQTPARGYEAARRLIERVTLHPDRLTVRLARRGLSASRGVGSQSDDGNHEAFILEAPVAFRRRGVETKILVNAAAVQPPGQKLIALVARSRYWIERIVRGDAATVREIARREGMDEGDVSRVLPLAFLAPDIVETILAGKHPPDLTAERLKRLPVLPHDWNE